MTEYLEKAVDKFIFRVAADRLYSADGVWALAEGNRVRVGITDYAQQLNGDATFVHLRTAGASLAIGDEFAELETIKATVSFFAPLRGAVTEVNTDLELSPEFVNQEPYGKGWLAVIEATDWQSDRAKLLDPQAYLSVMQSQAEEALKNE